MLDECSDWGELEAIGKTRIENYFAGDKKFPDPIKYGLKDGIVEFRMGEDATATNDIRVIDNDVARLIDEQSGATQEDNEH